MFAAVKTASSDLSIISAIGFTAVGCKFSNSFIKALCFCNTSVVLLNSCVVTPYSFCADLAASL